MTATPPPTTPPPPQPARRPLPAMPASSQAARAPADEVAPASATGREVLAGRHGRVGRRVLAAALVTAAAGAVVIALSGDAASAATHAGHIAGVLAAHHDKQPKNLGEVIGRLRNWIVGLLAALATLFLTVGGLRYLLAGGDPGEVDKGKRALTCAAIGYACAALAPLLFHIIHSIVFG